MICEIASFSTELESIDAAIALNNKLNKRHVKHVYQCKKCNRWHFAITNDKRYMTGKKEVPPNNSFTMGADISHETERNG